jgi:peptidoglycan/LPS O-acetylase OafA/YrhL
MKEIKALTSFRALAAFLVFMYHYAYLFSPQVRGVAAGTGEVPLMPLWRTGQVGVSLFFVLSGFLITRIYYDAMVDGRTTLRLFFVKRIARIWPLFLVYAAMQHGVSWWRGEGPSADWWVTLSMTQGFFARLRYAGLPTAWSLTIEETFYALAPLFFLVLHRLAFRGRRGPPDWDRRQLARFGLTLAVLAAGLLLCGGILLLAVRGVGRDLAGFLGTPAHVLHSTLFGRFPEFAVGMACAFVHRQGRLPHLLRGGRATALGLAAFLGIAGAMVLKDLALRHGWPVLKYVASYLVAGLTGGLILALSVEGGRLARLLSGGLLVYLGRISYGFYLVQLSVMMGPMLALTDRLGPLRLPALCLLMNLFCAASYELVERPARRWIVTRWGGRGVRARRSAGAGSVPGTPGPGP